MSENTIILAITAVGMLMVVLATIAAITLVAL